MILSDLIPDNSPSTVLYIHHYGSPPREASSRTHPLNSTQLSSTQLSIPCRTVSRRAWSV